MVRAKSVLNMMMMSFGALALISVLSVLYGYSMAFGNGIGGGLLGSPTEFFGLEGLMGTEGIDKGFAASSLVFTIPSMAFVGFQGVFAIITVALIRARSPTGRFGPWLLFAGIWATVVYFPVAHWVFAFDGAESKKGGWIARQPARDRLRGWHRGAHQRRWAGLALAIVLASASAGAGADAAAQPAAGDDRGRPAVVRLVRLQRGVRLAANGQAAEVWVTTLVATVQQRSAGCSWSGSVTVTPPRSARPQASSRVWARSRRPAGRSSRSARSRSASWPGSSAHSPWG